MSPATPDGDWRGRRTLVTGATGFIGAHLLRQLQALGADAHAVSSRPVSSADSGTSWHLADLRDPAATASLLKTTSPDVVFHLASMVTGARDPQLVLPILQSNLVSVVNLLTSATGTSISKLVLAGSIEEPRPGMGPGPISPYSLAKWAASSYAEMYHQLWNVPVTVLRIAMVYGPAQPDPTKLVPYVIRSMLRGEDPQLTSGARLVDWVYVEDVVAAFLSAADPAAACGSAVDIGSGVQTSLRETVDMIADIVGPLACPKFGAIADRQMDLAQKADVGPATELLGWRARTGLEEGLRRTVRWYVEQAADQ